MDSFHSQFEHKKTRIEDYIREDLAVRDVPYKTVLEAMRTGVLNGGKRIRPILMLSCYELYREDFDDIFPFLAAIEYIHNYSLIHDDLPAMDNDDFRRGKPTCHKVYGEAIAILAGDALLNLAYETMANANCENAVEAMRVISRAAGCDGMIGGQVLDMESEGVSISKEVIDELHSLKTGQLIKAACVAGGVLAGASKSDTDKLGEFGKLIGLSFQIQDDILDADSEEDKSGKKTYLSFYSMEECREINCSLIDRALKLVEPFGTRGDFLRQLTLLLRDRKI